jgi:ATP-binding cassette, subfamily B, bacterial PglK
MGNNFLYKLNSLLNRKDKINLFILSILSFILSIIETIGIGAIIPFISIASNPDLLNENKYFNWGYSILGYSSSNKFIIHFGVALILFYIFRGIYTVFHGYLMNKFSVGKHKHLAIKLFENYIHMPYRDFVNRNSATILKTIITEAGQLAFLFMNILIFLSETIVIVLIYILLLLVDIKMTMVLTLLLGFMTLLLVLTISKKIKKKGLQRALIHENYYRIISETLGNHKVIKFISNQLQIINKFAGISEKLANVNISNNTLQLLPRSFLEVIGLSALMGVVVYIVSFKDDVSLVIPVISMYALALYRILPAASRILNSYNNIVFFSASLNIVYNDLSTIYEIERSESILDFNHIIKLENVSFSYDLTVNIINNLSLEFEKGKRVALIGESGSGKSTLVDIICGIYKPESGNIYIDGKILDKTNVVSWRKKIGYIPQSIYLFDGTVAENITFGRNYDEPKLTEVFKKANIYDFIMGKDGFNTMVGEGGIQLSGGQKQRIGIARALYDDPEILVLDEATSALDTQTEKIIMDEIYKVSEGKTLMIIAHRLSTIDGCDIRIDLDKVNVK